MSFFDLLEEIKSAQEKAGPTMMMPARLKNEQTKQLLNAIHQFSEQELRKIDDKGNTVLHTLLTLKEPFFEVIDTVLKKAPELANVRNYAQQLPCDVIWLAGADSPITNRPVKALLYKAMEDSQAKRILDKEVNISLCERIAAKENDRIDHYSYIQPEDFDGLLKRPTLLCFSGRYTFSSREANGFGKLVRKTLEIYDIDTPQIQTLSAWYPGNTLDLSNDLFSFLSPYIKADNDSPFFYVKCFVERYFKPLYTDEDDFRLPVEQAAKNMRMVNILGYSYGSSVVQMLSNCLTEDMKKYGYTKDEMAFIQSQVCVLTIGYFANANNYKNHFSSYHIVHLEDEASYDTLSPVIEKKDIDKGEFYISELKRQPNQKIFVANDIGLKDIDDPHRITNYFKTRKPNTNHIILNLWKNAILINTLNSSIRNAQSDAFQPLSSELSQIPKTIDYMEKAAGDNFIQHMETQAFEVDYGRQIAKASRRVIAKHNNQFMSAKNEKIR